MLFDSANGARTGRIVVAGVDSENLSALHALDASNEAWRRVLRMTERDVDSIAIAGRYDAGGGLLTFAPAVLLDRGRTYTMRFDPGQLPSARKDSVLTASITLPSDGTSEPTVIARVSPSAAIVPENTLHLYIQFSAPMSRQAVNGVIHLIDDGGNEVKDAFQNQNSTFWNSDNTIYTAVFNRVSKAQALRAGRAYAIRVDSSWKDARGNTLAHSYRSEFRVGPALQSPITLAEWKVQAPRSGSRAPLVLAFPRPLDLGALPHALSIRTTKGETIEGTASAIPGEVEWRFVPASVWRAGDYRLVVSSALEDLAGNHVGQATSATEVKQAGAPAGGNEHLLPFSVR